MPKTPRIGWICNSAISTSETFLVKNLELLQSFADVMAFSGNVTIGQGHPSVDACNFDHVPQKLHHVLRRKLTGKDVRTFTKRRRYKRQLLPKLSTFEPDLLWIEFGTTAHIASDLLAALSKPYLIAVHGFDITCEFSDPWYKQEFVRLANASAGVICASQHTRNLCVTAGVNEQRCQLIRLPIDGQKLTPRFKTPTPPQASFVHLGRLVEKKGPIQTILAFEKVTRATPEATLTIIGTGPLESAVQECIARLNLSNSVQLIGALPQDKALQLTGKHAIFCQHSVTGKDGDQEGFALSPAEAALMEMPVISTVHNGIPEHVIHGTTGILVREWDIDAMAEAMLELALNPEKGQAMGRAGRQNILTMCDPLKRKLDLESLFNSVS